MGRILFFFCTLAVLGCGSAKPSSDDLTTDFSAWLGYMNIGEDSIPFRFTIDKKRLILENGEELIVLSPDSTIIDSTIYPFPQYESALVIYSQTADKIVGSWNYYSKGNYRLPFNAYTASTEQPSSPSHKDIYEVVFSPNSPSSYNAVGVFETEETGRMIGTFLTESGDYRYLEGRSDNGAFWLSCFDGAHLFYFTGTCKQDSVSGKFYSGNHWEESWIGIKNQNASLSHPDSLTFISSENDDYLRFVVKDFKSKSVSFGQEQYKNKVTIVQLFGSWCPNCYDELVLYSELNSSINDPRFQVIPVAFERTKDIKTAAAAINKLFDHAGVPFEPYYGGMANKTEASSVFNQLSPISSFPTSIIIGKDAVVRKIHTGFYGPGTGEYYQNYRTELEAYLIALLSE